MAEREPWETCHVEGDNVDDAWCLTHDQHPGDCWTAREARIKTLEAFAVWVTKNYGKATIIHEKAQAALAKKGD